jgi:hypothetical protein
MFTTCSEMKYYLRPLSGPDYLVGHLHNTRCCDEESPDLVLTGWNTYDLLIATL